MGLSNAVFSNRFLYVVFCTSNAILAASHSDLEVPPTLYNSSVRLNSISWLSRRNFACFRLAASICTNFCPLETRSPTSTNIWSIRTGEEGAILFFTSAWTVAVYSWIWSTGRAVTEASLTLCFSSTFSAVALSFSPPLHELSRATATRAINWTLFFISLWFFFLLISWIVATQNLIKISLRYQIVVNRLVVSQFSLG